MKTLLLLLVALLLALPATAQETESAPETDGLVEPMEEAGEAAAEAVEEVTTDAGQVVDETVDSMVSAVPTSVSDVTDSVVGTADRAWNDFLMPLYERFVQALPRVLQAFGLLILFWIVAVLVGRAVTGLLKRTSLDNRLASDLGMKEQLEQWEKKGTSLEGLAGTAAKWIILLLGFVAFFNTLQLTVVAGPLANIFQKLTESIPALLQAFAYLGIYWVVGSLLRLGITKGLGAAGFDDRVGRWIKPREVKGEMIGASGQLGRLVFYVVLLFGLPPFLQALGQEAAVQPLRDMMTKFFEFLPNVVAALILVFIGRIVATIVREVVTNFLAAAGADNLAQRFGLGNTEGSRNFSDIVGSVAFFFTFIPILVAAVDSLKIDAISVPVRNTLEQLLTAIPLIFVAILVMGIGWLIAKTVRGLVEGFLKGVGFDELPKRVGLDFLAPREGGASLSNLAGSAVMIIILLLTAQQALATLSLGDLSEMLGGLLTYLPNLLVGIAILLAAISLGNYVSGLITKLMADSVQRRVAATVSRFAIYFLGFSMGLTQLGVAENIVQVAVSAVLGGTALALGLAFGLGGQERAKEIIDRTR
ncbi:MAG: mechanosensitive ion channel [Acidobacteriota bacterium]